MKKDKNDMPQKYQSWHKLILKCLNWREFVCGCGAAFVNILVTYPIYKTIFRQTLLGIDFISAFGQLRREGFFYLYRGVLPPLAQKTVSSALMFGIYDCSRISMLSMDVNPYQAKIIAGLISGSVEAVLSPFERIQTLLADSRYHAYFKNSGNAVRYVLANHGLSEFYRGVYPILCRNGPSNALFFILREEAIYHLPDRDDIMSKTGQEFLAGALIGSSLSALFYPLNVVKVSMQSKMGSPREGMIKTFRNIYKERGYSIRLFYRGCWFNSSRAFVSWGIINTAYEHMKRIVYGKNKEF